MYKQLVQHPLIPGTVAKQGQARAADVLQMQAVVVDLDAGDIPAKLEHVTRHLGAGLAPVLRPSSTAGSSRRAAEELVLLPEGSVIAEMVSDYVAMREQVRSC